ncbi:hypothetical protein SAMN04489712_1454 [Thermomonospora echinospora]|uniref:Uncharacterized protein n=1 Tax=Thermomonospora echinospora TaxID=1992 RepID=A0A1H6EB19_9ACTN|nr:hypothetical protein [Thermomonospora echinospora]SEG94269.1 hypothetical protein SAMN04489712_1454 [Thermomonospora echinospora]
MPTITGAGRTTPGQNWQNYTDGPGIYLDVNTSSAGFNPALGTPVYTISLGGNQRMWYLAGSSSVYEPTVTGFRVYLRKLELEDGELTVNDAQQWGLHINWIGAQNL